MESYSLGPVPYEESCQQVGTPSYDPVRAKHECNVYKNMLQRLFPPPEGGSIRVKGFPRDGYTCLELIACFSDATSEKWASDLENNASETWDDIALKELLDIEVCSIQQSSLSSKGVME